MKIYEGKLNAEGLKFGIITSRFNELITNQLELSCIDALVRHGADKENNIVIYRVPGAFELPYLASKLAKSKQFDAIICLGAIVRAETMHFEYVATQTARGIANIALETGIPVIFGVITTDTVEQAIERAGVRLKNRGFEAAMVAIELANLYKFI